MYLWYASIVTLAVTCCVVLSNFISFHLTSSFLLLIVSHLISSLSPHLLSSHLSPLLSFPLISSLYSLSGIAVHHSGLLPILKETVELLFSRSVVKVWTLDPMNSKNSCLLFCIDYSLPFISFRIIGILPIAINVCVELFLFLSSPSSLTFIISPIFYIVSTKSMTHHSFSIYHIYEYLRPLLSWASHSLRVLFSSLLIAPVHHISFLRNPFQINFALSLSWFSSPLSHFFHQLIFLLLFSDFIVGINCHGNICYGGKHAGPVRCF